jgi:hypothetical protein
VVPFLEAAQSIKRLKLGILLFLTLLSLPFCCTCTAGSTGQTSLSDIQGEVLFRKAGSGDWVQAKVNLVLNVNDAIKSGTTADAKVTFFDGSTIELKINTQIEIKELVNGKTTSIRLKQEIGETLSKVVKMADPASRYEIETPAAIAGVRGSQMRVTVAADGTTEVQNLEGKISVTAQGVEVTVPEGKSSTVQPGQTPGYPVIIPYSAVRDFSLVKGNPNGSWSYGWMPADFSIFNFYTSHDYNVFNNYATPQWYAGLGSDRTPCIWINTGDVAYGVPTGWLSLHPGPGKEPSVLRWTAPVAGNIYITGEFLSGDSGKMIVAIRHNSQEIWAATDSGNFDLPVNVIGGNTIDFMVYGGYNYGNTPIRVNIRYGD